MRRTSSIFFAFVLLAVSVQGSFAFDYQLNVTGPIPLRSVLFLNKRGMPHVIAKPTSYWTSTRLWDNQLQMLTIDGRTVSNPSTWGLIGLPRDVKGAEVRSSFFDDECNQAGPLSPTQVASIGAIHSNAHLVGDTLTTWFHTYETHANDRLIFPPFTSAFSQASIIHALLFAHCKTGEQKHLNLAVRAGDALITPISEGGMTNDDAGETWFEELPAERGVNPYILNAHLYSINVLFLLSEKTGNPAYRDAAVRGTSTLGKLLPKFDTGDWSRYDLRPRYFDMYFEVHFNADVEVNRITIRKKGDLTPEGRYTLCPKGCDQPLSQARNGNSLRFSAVLEPLRSFSPVVEDEMEFSIEYKGSVAPKVYVAGIRPGLKEFVEIEPRSDKKGTVSGSIGVRDAGWHQPTDDYIKLHSFLLGDLYRHSRNPTFFVTAIRFANYLRVAENERKAGTHGYRKRHFDLVPSAEDDALIAQCFAADDPTTIDLSKASIELPKCVPNGRDLPSLFRRMGFVTNYEQNIKILD
jgi:D-glucuronyl C5-epimerase C-terminus